MTRINLFRAAVVLGIKSMLPLLRSCEEQFGRFNLEDLDTTSVAAPAVRFAVLDADLAADAADQMEATLRCAAFIITEGKDRDQQAWAMAEAMALRLGPGQRWGLTTRTMPPTNVRIQPVVSGAIKRRAVTLLAVEWKQQLLGLGDSVFDDQGAVIEGLYINGDQVEPEAADA